LFQPLVQALLDELGVCFWQVELFPENGLIILEIDLVREVLRKTQVVFIHAYGRLVFEQGVDVLAPV
jgi:hypothetical protein